MSKLINNTKKRVEQLLAFSLGMMSGEDGRALMEKYKTAIEGVTPHDVMKFQDRQLEMGLSAAEIKKDIGKVLNILHQGLRNYEWKKPDSGTFLYYLMLENSTFEFRLNGVKKILKNYRGKEESDFGELKRELLAAFKQFEQFEAHYVKKENILFPFLEKKWKNYRPLTVMWSLHDDIRKKLKKIVALLRSETTVWKELNREIGAYYFLVFGMIHKEELIIYPVAAETLTDEEWNEMHHQSFEYPFPFIESPSQLAEKEDFSQKDGAELSFDGTLTLKSETGELTAEQMLLLVNNLPLDVTFVDEHNKVRFFSKPTDRFFPRSPAIIGRDVNKCHPPESVHIVEKIVQAFKDGKKERTSFWLEMRGKFILIQYFALRNEKNEYKGVLEVSQDVTDIRKLQGEQRLLDWE